MDTNSGSELTLNAPLERSYFEADNSPGSDSILGLIDAKYTNWEWSLSETRPVSIGRGLSVYPLAQVEYAGVQLPIVLYIPPLRGTDAR